MEKGIRCCLECGKRIYGRLDKKFCNDTCRATFLNRKYRGEDRELHFVNRILKKNHRILNNLVSNGITECFTRELYLKGFNFDYFTSIKKGTHSVTYCYDIGYRIKGKKLLITL